MEFALPAAWHRLADETAAAYIAFRTYLDLGPGRTVNAAYRMRKGAKSGEGGRTVRAHSRWYAWADRHSWEERAAAYDAHVEREVIQANAGTIANARRQSDETSLLLQSKITGDIMAFPEIPMAQQVDPATGKIVMVPLEVLTMDEYLKRAQTLYRLAAAWRYATMTRLMALGAPREEGDADVLIEAGGGQLALRVQWDDYGDVVDDDGDIPVEPSGEADEPA